MKEHLDDFEDMFRDSFENARVTPPEHVWEAIDQQLASKNKRKFWRFWFGMGSAMLVTVALPYFIPTDSSSVLPENTASSRSKLSIQKEKEFIAKRLGLREADDTQLAKENLASKEATSNSKNLQNTRSIEQNKNISSTTDNNLLAANDLITTTAYYSDPSELNTSQDLNASSVDYANAYAQYKEMPKGLDGKKVLMRSEVLHDPLLVRTDLKFGTTSADGVDKRPSDRYLEVGIAPGASNLKFSSKSGYVNTNTTDPVKPDLGSTQSELQNTLQEKSVPAKSTSLYLNVGKRFGKHFGLRSGVELNHLSYSIETTDIAYQPRTDLTTNAYVYLMQGQDIEGVRFKDFEEVTTSHHFTVFVPVELSYRFGNQGDAAPKAYLEAFLGMKAGLMAKSLIESPSAVAEFTAFVNNPFNNLQLSSTTGLSVNYPIGQGCVVSIAPCMQLGINQFMSNQWLESRLDNLTLRASVRKSL